MALRHLAKRSFALSILYYGWDNFRRWLRLASGDTTTDSGMSHAHGDSARSVAYIEEVFGDYKHYAGVTAFRGRVAEIGPGDNCGVALMFLADGCESVDLADRLYSRRDARLQEDIYRRLAERHATLRESVVVQGELKMRGITWHTGLHAAAEVFFETRHSYQYIVSRAVLEHVSDPLLALERMVAALDEGGMLLHEVDLRDHGMFPEHHELKFLEVPGFVYQLMTRAAGRPNRILINAYRETLEALAVDYCLLITRLAGVGDINPHRRYEEIAPELREMSLRYVRSVRARFARQFSRVTDADLSVAGFFLVATKRRRT